jgi:hypothetical protein
MLTPQAPRNVFALAVTFAPCGVADSSWLKPVVVLHRGGNGQSLERHNGNHPSLCIVHPILESGRYFLPVVSFLLVLLPSFLPMIPWIDNLHAKITAAGTPVRANRIIEMLRKAFNLAIRKEWIDRNPCIGTHRNNEEARTNYLEANMLHKVLLALETHPQKTSADAIRFLIFTGARRGETFKAKWSEIDKMADYILAHYDTLDKLKLSKANINAAVMYVIRDFTAIGQNAMSQRLTRAWVREMKERPISVHPDGQKSFSSHPRMEQAYFRNKRKESL